MYSVLITFLIIGTILFYTFGSDWLGFLLIFFVFAPLSFITSILIGLLFVKVSEMMKSYILTDLYPSGTNQKIIYVILFTAISLFLAAGIKSIFVFDIPFQYYLIFSSTLLIAGRAIKFINRDVAATYGESLIDIILAFLFIFTFVISFKFIIHNYQLLTLDEIITNIHIPILIGLFAELMETITYFFRPKKFQSKISYFIFNSFVDVYDKQWEQSKKNIEREKSIVSDYIDYFSKLEPKNTIERDESKRETEAIFQQIFPLYRFGIFPRRPDLDKSLNILKIFDRFIEGVRNYFIEDAKTFELDFNNNIKMSDASKRLHMHTSIIDYDYATAAAGLYYDALIVLLHELKDNPSKLKIEEFLKFLNNYLEIQKNVLSTSEYRRKCTIEGFKASLKLTDISILINNPKTIIILIMFVLDFFTGKIALFLMKRRICSIEKIIKNLNGKTQ